VPLTPPGMGRAKHEASHAVMAFLFRVGVEEAELNYYSVSHVRMSDADLVLLDPLRQSIIFAAGYAWEKAGLDQRRVQESEDLRMITEIGQDFTRSARIARKFLRRPEVAAAQTRIAEALLLRYRLEAGELRRLWAGEEPWFHG
jgi:hypothetical protein